MSFEVIGTFRTPGPFVDALKAEGLSDLIELNLADSSAYRRLPDKVDAIVHVAGISAADDVSNDEMLGCNVDGARNLVAYARRAGVRQLIYASTLSVHGRIDDPVVGHDTPVVEPDVYGASKYLAERLFADASTTMAVAAVRLPGVLGRGAHRAFIPKLAERVLAGKEVTIFNPDAPFNNAVHVNELSILFASMLGGRWKGFHAFPVGAAGVSTVREMVCHLMDGIGRHVPMSVGPSRATSFTVCSDYAISRFGYAPSAIDDMIGRYARDLLTDQEHGAS